MPWHLRADHFQTMIDYEHPTLSLSYHFGHFWFIHLNFHVFQFLFCPRHLHLLDWAWQLILCESRLSSSLLLRQPTQMDGRTNYVPITNFLHFCWKAFFGYWEHTWRFSSCVCSDQAAPSWMSSAVANDLTPALVNLLYLMNSLLLMSSSDFPTQQVASFFYCLFNWCSKCGHLDSFHFIY